MPPCKFNFAFALLQFWGEHDPAYDTRCEWRDEVRQEQAWARTYLGIDILGG